MRRDPSQNQNDETMPISEAKRDNKGERDEREGQRESPVNQRRKERSQTPEEKRENSVRERNDILMEWLIKYY